MEIRNNALLNKLNTLAAVEIDGVDRVRLRFTDKNKPSLDHFNEVRLKRKNNSLKMAEKFTPLIGENLILQGDGEKITFWKGEFGKAKDWSDKKTIKLDKFKVKKVEKTAEEWQEQFMALHKQFEALKAKKGFKLYEYRSAMRKEIETVLNKRIDLARNHGTAVEQNTLNIIQFALNDLGDPEKSDVYVEFMFEIDEPQGKS